MIFVLFFGIPALAVLAFIVCLCLRIRWKRREPDGAQYHRFRFASIVTGVIALVLTAAMLAVLGLFMLAITHM